MCCVVGLTLGTVIFAAFRVEPLKEAPRKGVNWRTPYSPSASLVHKRSKRADFRSLTRVLRRPFRCRFRPYGDPECAATGAFGCSAPCESCPWPSRAPPLGFACVRRRTLEVPSSRNFLTITEARTLGRTNVTRLLRRAFGLPLRDRPRTGEGGMLSAEVSARAALARGSAPSARLLPPQGRVRLGSSRCRSSAVASSGGRAGPKRTLREGHHGQWPGGAWTVKEGPQGPSGTWQVALSIRSPAGA